MIVNMMMYVMMISGIIIYFEEELLFIYHYSLKKSKAFYRHEEEGKKKLIDSNDLVMLLNSTLGFKGDKSINRFISFSIVLSILTVALLLNRINITMVLMVSAVVSLLPYIVLRTKLKVDRRTNANEGDLVIAEILNSYKFTGYNMRAAIEHTALNMTNAPHMKNVILDLSKDMNLASDERDIKKSLFKFRYKVNTAWSDILSSNMYFALTKGVVVTDALADLLQAVENSKTVKEHLKRESNEANLMIIYMAPICYLLTVIGGIKFFNFTLKKFFSYQFLTDTGIKWFLVIVITYCIGILAKIYINDNKLDI
ncbi:MAG: hypothetical protein JJE03_01815 [Peptostreptococcaceae bacterium]|nr:hypothetical protein [Peptostreptococcaceae bacterium]